MDTQPYRYHHLSAERHEIRLLHLHPGNWHDDISCHLTHVSLDEEPKFEALSYVWGNPQDVVSVGLDASAFEVTRNLELAIRRLRRMRDERVIWIDQLCINQADMVEKSKQVAMMPRIYKSCEEALFWLGAIEAFDGMAVKDATDDAVEWHIDSTSAAGVDLIRQLGSGKHVHEMPCFRVSDESKLTVAPSYAAGFEGICLVTELSYWERAWIVQENILPAKATALLGSCSLPWNWLINAAKHWSTHTLSCCRLLIDTLPLETRNTILHFSGKVTPVMNMSVLRGSGPGPCLLDVLRRTRTRKASDDRDKVFSVLGLVTNWLDTSPIQPDYTLTTAQVYALVSEHLISSMSGSLVYLVGNYLRRQHIPSWVPDWAAEDNSLYPHELSWGEFFYNLYDASMGRPAIAKRHSDSILLLDGYFVDHIVVVGDAMEVHDWKSAVPILDTWIGITEVNKHAKKPYPAGADLEEAFWRCLIGNAYCEGGQITQIRKAVPEDYNMYKLWDQEVRTATEGQWMLSDKTLPFQLIIPFTARHRRLFITKEGYFGMGPPSAQVGDHVHVLLGSRVPFISRPSAPGGDTEQGNGSIGTFSLVGECYVHGIMDGEIISDAKLKKETMAFC